MNTTALDAAFPTRPAPRTSPARTAALVIATFLIVNAIGLAHFRWLAGDLAGWPRMAALAGLGYGLYLLAPAVLARWLLGAGRVREALGLTGPALPAFAFAAGCSAIVLVGIAATSSPVDTAKLPLDLVRSAVLPGIAEELLFRAFLFGFLYRYAGWGFLPAALLSSAIFGIEHLWQGGDAVQALGIALLTGLGGLWWSWLWVEWRWNLWVPIAFHVLLNGYWAAFDVADDAMGPAFTVGLRLACIALSVGLTWAWARRHGGLQVRGRRWWRGP